MELNSVLKRNIEVLRQKREEEESSATGRDRLAQTISKTVGSLSFVVAHGVFVLGWVAVNAHLLPGITPFDPTLVMLATVASVEALFLSTFVLISQNRAAELADRRSDLDVQISLLTEHEVTRVLTLCTEIAERLNVRAARDPELDELKKDVAPEHVIEELETAQKGAEKPR